MFLFVCNGKHFNRVFVRTVEVNQKPFGIIYSFFHGLMTNIALNTNGFKNDPKKKNLTNCF